MSVETKPRKRVRVIAGDVYAVPLDAEHQSFGYIRAYRDVDIAVLPVLSKGRILSITQISTLNSVLDVFLFQEAIREGRWPRVGNVPFRVRVIAGDVYAVPLDAEHQSFGYIRAYRDVDIAVLPVLSKGRILSITQISTLNSVLDVFLFQEAIREGRWPRVGNVPFEDDASAWAPPRKQVAAIRPDVRMVVFQGHFIPAAKFGQYDNLPEFRKFDENDVIEEILRRSGDFLVFDS